MATNEVFKVGNFVSLPVPVGTVSGQAVRVGGLNGVAQTSEPTAELAGKGPYVKSASGNIKGYASLALEGAFYLQIPGNTPLTPGAPVYITPAGALSTTDNSGANAVFGHALTSKAGAPGKVVVRISN